ncbi:MAG: hypothetical protein Q7S96_04215 [bacterium]|nr:hypothetical protein [bacterium]
MSSRSKHPSSASLSIDTTGERGFVRLTDERSGRFVTRSFTLISTHERDGALLRAVERACTALGVDRCAIAAVDVVPGPGRFSAVRLGVVTANALAQALSIPLSVRGTRTRLALPEYGSEPSITQRRADG